MNIFSRAKNAIIGMFGGRPTKHSEVSTVHERRTGKLRFDPLKTHKVRFRPSNGQVKGPVFVPPSEIPHISRQIFRAHLRNLFFFRFSKEYPNASRRQRRRVSRLVTQAEYRRMMRHSTNEGVGA